MNNIKIPPSYKNVHISKDKNSKILAYGFDSKNRKQVIYNPDYIIKQKNIKYNKIIKLNKVFNKIINDINDNINLINNDEIKLTKKDIEISIIIYLIINCGFRVGNEKYKYENNSYGICTIRFNHIIFNKLKKNIIIDFIGKKGIKNKSECFNNNIILYLYEKYKKTNDKNRAVFDYNSIDVNNFLKKYNKKITSKDLRTWNANSLLLKYIKLPDILKNKNPIKKAIEKVSYKLHNTYNICIKSYINPLLIEKLKYKLKNKIKN